MSIKNKKKKLSVKAVIAAILALALVLCTFSACSGRDSDDSKDEKEKNSDSDYDEEMENASGEIEDSVRIFVKSFQKNDESYIDKLLSSYIDVDNEEYSSYGASLIENAIEYFENELDSENFKITYEIKKIEELSENDVEKLAEKLAENSTVSEDDADEIKESAINKVKIKLIANSKGEKENIKFDHMYFIKEDGKWKILSLFVDLKE